MKKSLISFCFVAIAMVASAQISMYSSYDNEEDVVYDVEDMYPEEIKVYNKWINEGMEPYHALLFINAGRAQDNLIAAPATIIDYMFTPEITEEDSIPGAIGAIGVYVNLINTTPKVIKEITLQFEFENNSTPVYDIKSGDQYLVLKFKNLTGRTKSDIYKTIAENLMSVYHSLSLNDATYKRLFYNKKATSIKLHSARIVYADGSTSNKIAIFDNGYYNTDKLFYDGPLCPATRFIKNRKN